MDDRSTFCVYPWDSAIIRPDGLALPCCRYPHLDILKEQSTIDKDFRNSEHWNLIRRKMLANEEVEGCSLCYQEEKNQIKSMRQAGLSRGNYRTENPAELRYLELTFSNLCNLACVSCSAEFSSKWKAEDIKRGRLNKDKALVTHGYSTNNMPIDLTKVETLKIMGGEPFLEQEKFIQLMERLNLENLKLIVYTNGTILPNDYLKSLIDRCKEVRFAVSVDGLGTINDWYRWPSKFEDVEKNLNVYNKWWSDDQRFLLLIHHVINVYNVWTIKEFSDFVVNRFEKWHVEWDWINWPTWQRISVIPENFKKILIDKFLVYANLYDRANKPYRTTVNHLLENSPQTWEDFKTMTKRFEKERGLDVLKLIPSIEEPWNYVNRV